MVNVVTIHKLTIKPKEALLGTKRLIVRKGKKLEVTIPPGVANGTLIKLSGALQITDGCYGDLLIQIIIKQTYRTVWIATLIILAFFIISSALIINQITGHGYGSHVTVYHDKQPTEFQIYGEKIDLINNDSAKNPSWEILTDFLYADKTDSKPYTRNYYECGQFARDVHNNAEAAGIKAAFVAVVFKDDEEGHALNAFDTIEYGLVYVDCSGGTEANSGWDTIGYIEKGRECGFFRISEARHLDYDYYYYYSEKQIEPLGIVDEVFIYW